ncbi:CLUMA_CG000164, isoform C, partial [Clunio marinus]
MHFSVLLALGDEKGEMEVTPACYAHLLSPLLSLASGRVAVVLEGGYCLESLAEGAALTLKTLLGDPCPRMQPLEVPSVSIQETILNCIYVHRSHWRNLCLQNVYNIEELNNINPQPNLHKVPHESFIGGPSNPIKFETRNCYPIQSETFKKEVAEKLEKLKFFTNLTFPTNRVCFVYDELMMKHENIHESGHPEQPERIKKIFSTFDEYKLLNRMKSIASRIATEEEISLVHSASHIEHMKEIVAGDDLNEAGRRFNSVYFHPSTYECATTAVGSVLQVVDDVLNGESRSGVCVVRPPGHHAESDEPHGFCIFNNVSIATQYALNNYGLKRILIIDWDVHHGQGTQHIFENDPKVLYISIHRYDNGNFFPNSTDANFTEVGEGIGKGFNVNIPWNKKGMGDMEYILTFQSIIMPIAYEFDPELVIVSAGFDACIGDQLGGCKVTPEAYGHLTHWLSALANGKIILCLEGGYNVNSISHSMTLCTKSLLGDPLPMLYVSPRWDGINASALETLKNVIDIQSKFWKCLKFNKKLPDFDVTDTKMDKVDLVKEMETLTINSPSDDGDNDNDKSKQIKSAGIESSNLPGTSGNSADSAENKQTLTEFLKENLEVNCLKVFNEFIKIILFIFKALNNEEMFAIVPLKFCPHLALNQMKLLK